MSTEDFLADEAHGTSFINRISAFLAIPFDRVRIVGIASSSRRRQLESGSEIEFVIVGDTPGTKNTGY